MKHYYYILIKAFYSTRIGAFIALLNSFLPAEDKSLIYSILLTTCLIPLFYAKIEALYIPYIYIPYI